MPVSPQPGVTSDHRAKALERDLRSLVALIELLVQIDHPESPKSKLRLHSANQVRIDHFVEVLAKWGCDKVTDHDYGPTYASLFSNPKDVKTVVEIGIGSTDPKIPSHREVGSSPGSSLRAWRELFPNAQIVGADIDRSVLFEEDGIRCFHVDECDPSSCGLFANRITTTSAEVDLIIDDGLHEPLANFTAALSLFPLLRKGGLYVIEDINASLMPIYERSLPRLLNADSSTFLDLRHSRSGRDNCMFIARR